MGNIALDSHASGIIHKQKVLESSQGLDVFFKKLSQPAVTTGEAASMTPSKNVSSKTNSGSIDALLVNAEVFKKVLDMSDSMLE